MNFGMSLIHGECKHMNGGEGGQDRAAVKRPLSNDKDVGSNPAPAKRKTDIGGPPPQKVAPWSEQDLSGRPAM